VSAGSACAADTPEASHVLRGLGLSDALAASSLRFSVGRFTTEDDIAAAAGRVAVEVARLRELAKSAPAWCSS
jgi:cysteine desulfurase